MHLDGLSRPLARTRPMPGAFATSPASKATPFPLIRKQSAMAEKKKHELTDEELKQAAGGIYKARATKPMQDAGGTVVSNDSGGSESPSPSIGGVEELPDPRFGLPG